jgi:hypothetical protein
MLPDNSLLLKCPFCGKEKEVLSLMSGNTIRGRQWSDLKSVYPMLPKVSPIQKCPSCGKYYFTENVEKRQGNGYSFAKGDLTYQELKEAAVQFGDTLEKKDRDTLNMLLLWAYNDLYNREGVETTDPPKEEKWFMADVFDELLSREDVDNIVYAEFWREAGDYDDALDLLERCHPEGEFLAKIVERMKHYARERKTIAFEIK